MPVYEFHCPNCQADFELFRSMSHSSEEAQCPQCQSPAQRVYSLFRAYARAHGTEGIPGFVPGVMRPAGTSLEETDV